MLTWWKTTFFAAILAVGWGLFGGQAAAESDPGPVALGDEQAELYRQAMDSLDGSNEGYNEARTLLEAALVVGDESELLWLSLGRVHQLAGNCPEAVEAFARSEQAPPTADVDPEEAEANRRDYRAEMGDECDGAVYFDCLSDHTELISEDIDGLRCGEEIDVEPGHYEVEAALGQVATTLTVDVDPGESDEVFVGLQLRADDQDAAAVEDDDITAEVADADSTEEVRQSEEIAAHDQPGSAAVDEPTEPEAPAEEPAEESAAEIEAEPVELDGGQIAWSTMRRDVVEGTASRGRDRLPDSSGTSDPSTTSAPAGTSDASGTPHAPKDDSSSTDAPDSSTWSYGGVILGFVISDYEYGSDAATAGLDSRFGIDLADDIDLVLNPVFQVHPTLLGDVLYFDNAVNFLLETNLSSGLAFYAGPGLQMSLFIEPDTEYNFHFNGIAGVTSSTHGSTRPFMQTRVHRTDFSNRFMLEAGLNFTFVDH